MIELAEIITGEFTDAVEVKNPESLKRGIFLLLSSTVKKEEYAAKHDGLKDSIKTLSQNVELIVLQMKEGFKRMDKRFEAMQQQMDKRFESIDKRFNRMTVLMSIGFVVVTTLITVYRFLG